PNQSLAAIIAVWIGGRSADALSRSCPGPRQRILCRLAVASLSGDSCRKDLGRAAARVRLPVTSAFSGGRPSRRVRAEGCLRLTTARIPLSVRWKNAYSAGQKTARAGCDQTI